MAKTKVDLEQQGKSIGVAKLLVGAASTGLPTAQALSGDITISSLGVTAIGSLKVTDGMLAGNISTSKLSDSANFLLKNTSNTIADTVRYTYATSQTFSNGLNLVTKEYVDAVAGGLDIHSPAAAATTGPINLATNGLTSVDGVTLVDGVTRVLVKNQSSASENGIYVAATGPWSRAADANTNGQITNGLFIAVLGGTANGGSEWVVTTLNPINIGVTAITFELFSSASTNAATLGGLTNTSFLRTDANSSLLSGSTLNIASGATFTLTAGSTWNIGATAVTATAAQLNALGLIVTRETPSGTVDSTTGSDGNGVFTLAHTPIVGSESVYVNGIMMDPLTGNDYTISGGTITFEAGSYPLAGSKVRVSYRY